ncbi:hypothetical protein C7M84_018850 [Penaeus vannamei]|uniref:Uncharacterized protein n=1 Tax=Penaeus vannamei TaxID=6689 RepID=A0A3R7QCH0_PENVA|nr:hypothetical protein C7M84_018850 [Penaeus vannamei]
MTERNEKYGYALTFPHFLLSLPPFPLLLLLLHLLFSLLHDFISLSPLHSLSLPSLFPPSLSFIFSPSPIFHIPSLSTPSLLSSPLPSTFSLLFSSPSFHPPHLPFLLSLFPQLFPFPHLLSILFSSPFHLPSPSPLSPLFLSSSFSLSLLSLLFPFPSILSISLFALCPLFPPFSSLSLPIRSIHLPFRLMPSPLSLLFSFTSHPSSPSPISPCALSSLPSLLFHFHPPSPSPFSPCPSPLSLPFSFTSHPPSPSPFSPCALSSLPSLLFHLPSTLPISLFALCPLLPPSSSLSFPIHSPHLPFRSASPFSSLPLPIHPPHLPFRSVLFPLSSLPSLLFPFPSILPISLFALCLLLSPFTLYSAHTRSNSRICNRRAVFSISGGSLCVFLGILLFSALFLSSFRSNFGDGDGDVSRLRAGINERATQCGFQKAAEPGRCFFLNLRSSSSSPTPLISLCPHRSPFPLCPPPYLYPSTSSSLAQLSSPQLPPFSPPFHCSLPLLLSPLPPLPHDALFPLLPLPPPTTPSFPLLDPPPPHFLILPFPPNPLLIAPPPPTSLLPFETLCKVSPINVCVSRPPPTLESIPPIPGSALQ